MKKRVIVEYKKAEPFAGSGRPGFSVAKIGYGEDNFRIFAGAESACSAGFCFVGNHNSEPVARPFGLAREDLVTEIEYIGHLAPVYFGILTVSMPVDFRLFAHSSAINELLDLNYRWGINPLPRLRKIIRRDIRFQTDANGVRKLTIDGIAVW